MSSQTNLESSFNTGPGENSPPVDSNKNIINKAEAPFPSPQNNYAYAPYANQVGNQFGNNAIAQTPWLNNQNNNTSQYLSYSVGAQQPWQGNSQIFPNQQQSSWPNVNNINPMYPNQQQSWPGNNINPVYPNQQQSWSTISQPYASHQPWQNNQYNTNGVSQTVNGTETPGTAENGRSKKSNGMSWKKVLDFVLNLSSWFQKIAFLINDTVDAIYMFTNAMLRILDRLGAIYGEVMRLLLYWLGFDKGRIK